MRRLVLIAIVLLLLAGTGVVVWTAAGQPPVRMVWRYGFSYGPEPTGRKLTVEGVEFVEIGPGCVRMGSDRYACGGDRIGRLCADLGLPWGDQPEPSQEMPVHWVQFEDGFWTASTEVTNVLYESFEPAHARDRFSPGDSHPVNNVLWDEAQRLCAHLSEKSSFPIRLLSEAEWECACRAGTRSEYSFGDDPERLCDHGWVMRNSGVRLLPPGTQRNVTLLIGEWGCGAHPVGRKQPNAWGLYDMYGNVNEWCEDEWHVSYTGVPADGTARVNEGAPGRVNRGGNYSIRAVNCRSASRMGYARERMDPMTGIRLALSRTNGK